MCARVPVLTAAGDLMVFTVVEVVFGVRVVEDGPAFIGLHGVTVALVMDLSAPIHQHSTSPNSILTRGNVTLNVCNIYIGSKRYTKCR